jgi:hypothetical protein
MALAFWFGLVGFIIGAVAFRGRKPLDRPEPTCPCPYCKKPAPFVITSITIKCPTCGSSVLDEETHRRPEIGS